MLATTTRVGVSEMIVSETGSAVGYYYLAETHRLSGSSKGYVEWIYKCALMMNGGLKEGVYDGLSKVFHMGGSVRKRVIALQACYLFKPTLVLENTIISLTKGYDFGFGDITNTRDLLEHTIVTIMSGRSANFIIEALHSCLFGTSELKLASILPSVLALFAYEHLDTNLTIKECIGALTEAYGLASPSQKDDLVVPGDLLFEELELASLPSFRDVTSVRRMLYEDTCRLWVAKQHKISFDNFQRIQCVIYLSLSGHHER